MATVSRGSTTVQDPADARGPADARDPAGARGPQAPGGPGPDAPPPATTPHAPGAGTARPTWSSLAPRLLLLAAGVSVLELAVLLAPAPALPLSETALHGVVLTLFWLLGPGGAVAARLHLTAPTRIAATPLLGLSLLLATSVVGAWTGLWWPRSTAAATAVLTLVLALDGLVRHRAATAGGLADPPRPRRDQDRRAGALVVPGGLVLAVGLWAVSLPGARDAEPSVLGLLTTAPMTLPASLAVLALVLVAALRRGSTRSVLAVAATGALLLRTTPALITSVPIYGWTYKHLGVVDALQQYRQVLGGTDIYQNWPAMFAAGAWFSEVSGVAPLDVAHWTTPVVTAVLAVLVGALARAVGGRGPACAAAAALVVPLDWVGQDYYAPQALGVLLATGTLLLAVQSRRSRTAAVLAVLVFAVLVPTHQLTPFWVLGTAVLLLVVRRVAWWVPVLMGLVALGYLLLRLDVVASYGLFSGFDPLGNAQGNTAVTDVEGRRTAAVFARASALAVMLPVVGLLVARCLRVGGGAGGWRSHRPDAGATREARVRAGVRRALRSRSAAVPAVLAMSAFALLAGQNYGGEAILRVVLYSAPGAAVVLGAALADLARRRRAHAVAAGAWTLLVVGVTAQAYFGAWSVNLVHREDVDAVLALARDVEPPAAITPVVPYWPEKMTAAHLRSYAADPLYDAPLTDTGLTDVDYSDPADLERLEVVLEERGVDTHLVFTASMRAADRFYGVFPDGGYDGLLAAVGASDRWQLEHHDGDARVYRFDVDG